MFKKMLVVGLATLLSCGVAFGFGGFGKGGSIDAQPRFETEGDISGTVTFNGGAGGVAGSIGASEVSGKGKILFGDIDMDGVADAGAWAGSDSFTDYDIEYANGALTLSNSVESHNQAEGMASSSFDIGVDGFLGGVHAEMHGIAGEGTVAGATMSNFGGSTYVIAGQGAVGGFQSDGVVGIFIGEADAGAKAELNVMGYTNVTSGAWITFGKDYVSEGVGSSVAMGTQVTAGGANSGDSECLAIGGASLNGGWVAGGGAVLSANQGGANANASGYYKGSGGLNQDYNANLNGSVQTSVTYYDDGFMHGQSSHAESHMHINNDN